MALGGKALGPRSAPRRAVVVRAELPATQVCSCPAEWARECPLEAGAVFVGGVLPSHHHHQSTSLSPSPIYLSHTTKHSGLGSAL